MSDFSEDPKSPYQRAYSRFHNLCVLVGKPKGMISKKVYKVRQAHNRVHRERKLTVQEYHSINFEIQRALDSCIKNLDSVESKIERLLKK